jgi:hypothetical protein
MHGPSSVTRRLSVGLNACISQSVRMAVQLATLELVFPNYSLFQFRTGGATPGGLADIWPSCGQGEWNPGLQSRISQFYSLFLGFGGRDDFAHDWQHRHPVAAAGHISRNCCFSRANCTQNAQVLAAESRRERVLTEPTVRLLCCRKKMEDIRVAIRSARIGRALLLGAGQCVQRFELARLQF